jgi:hypothetical protein
MMGVRPNSLALVVCCLAILVIAGAPSGWSQATSTSTITGQVTDPQGAAVAGAEVRLLDTGTGGTQVALTNEAGRYIFVNLSTGTYDLMVSKAGFTAYRVKATQVSVGSTLTINAALQLGATSTTIEVMAAAAAELQTTNAAVGTTIDSTALTLLPNLGRDASTLAVLQPGTTPDGYVAGVFRDQNTFQLDGGNASSDMDGTQTTYTTAFSSGGGNPTGVIPVPVESIEEFRVATFNQTADFNGSAGSQVQMATKRGTNQWHGSGYEYYFATNVGAANLWANNHKIINGQATPLPSNHRNRFGGTLGGQLIPKKILGGKTYFFVNFEGFRFPNVSTYEHIVPSELLRLGVVQIPDASGKNYLPYNLNPYAVTDSQGNRYDPAVCPAGPCDPRGIGINPIVKQIWTKQMPMPNDLNNFGDHYNTQGYLSSLRAPQRSNSYISRIDHDFGERWRFMTSYRYTRYVELNTAQVDIGGVLPGATLGTPVATAPRDQLPGYFITGLTTNITPTTTNNFRFNYTRNFWQWGTFGAPAQIAGMGAALEIGGESSTNNLTPYTTNTQNVRRRYWDGIDKVITDDLTLIKGTHLFQFGGTYQRNRESHQRDDNGQASFADPTYISTNSGISFPSQWIPSAIPASQITAANVGYTNLYAEVLGIVSLPQVVYVRAGNSLTLQPKGVPATDHSIVPSYSMYFSDTWHMKPTFTLTYGLGYLLEMPPYEVDGKQVTLVDGSGNRIEALDYMAQRKKAALAGQVYQPTIGFATVRNVGTGLKYPFEPYYGGFSPRVSAAWSPKYSSGLLGKIFGDSKTVIRAGYGRIYGRLNGVALLLVPLLAPGPLQAVNCPGPTITGHCLGAGADPSNAFRIGTDGLTAPLSSIPVSQTFPQPFYPGTAGNAVAGDGSVLDPKYRPNRTDNFTISIQRQVTSKTTLEVGYIGRLLRNEFQEIQLDAVPYMTTLGGQSFAQAWAKVYSALYPNGLPVAPATNMPSVAAGLAPQPFFEAALGGAGSSYCSGSANCTAAVVSKNLSLVQYTRVSDFWKALNASPSWTLGRSMISGTPSQASSIGEYGPFGHGNYNALFVTVRFRDWKGFTAVSNFTWGRALGTGDIAQSTSSATVMDPFNVDASYGPQAYDRKFIYNLSLYYQAPYFRSQKGLLGHILGGWTIAPLFTAATGVPLRVTYSESGCTTCQAFGEVTPPASVTTNAEGAVAVSPYTGTTSAKYNVAGSVNAAFGGGVGTNNPTGINMFADPASVIAQFRPCVLGIDTSCGGVGGLRGLPTWNLDATVAKEIGIHRERFGATLVFQFTNILNHMQPANPTLTLTSPNTFGAITDQSNSPRSTEFGFRLHF